MPEPKPPIASRKDHSVGLHGRKRNDPYHWLRDPDWQAVMRDPDVLQREIREYLEAENAYVDAVMAPTDAVQDNLFEEMKARIKEDDSSVPLKHGPYEYYIRYETGGEHPIFCRRELDDADSEQIIFHGDQEAKGHSYFQIGGMAHSPDHTLLCYATDTNGSEFYTVRTRRLDDGEEFSETIENCSGGIAWAGPNADGGHQFFYTVLDENHRPVKVMRHRVGDAPENDILIYEESDPAFFLSVSKTESRRFILISAHDHQTSEIRILPSDQPNAPPTLIAPRTPELEYSVSDHGDQLYILTNADGAEDFKIMAAPIAAPGRENWRDWLQHKPRRLIRDAILFQDFMVRLERVDALPRIVISEFAGDGAEGPSHEISFPEEAYDLGASGGYEFATDNLRFSYSSPTTPNQTFDYNMRSRKRILRKTQEVPSGHLADNYVTRRLSALANDGETVPVTILHHKDTGIDGSAPLLLYGYGSYGHAIPAAFSTNRLSLVDRGFIYAIAHIRGGKDKGYGWYTDGKRLTKKNTFTDFVDCARFLIAEKYTSPGNIVIHGGSAGGMLVGAAVNMAPNLLAGVIADVPFVDVLSTICDETLPLTPPEWTEWGNPIDDPEVYDYMASYSPYDNVTAQDYPHILAMAGLTDPRVTYWEPAKWIAKLRYLNTSDATLLLKTNMDAGHGGASGRFDRLKEVALEYAFALKATGRFSEN
jgi:oligopeptidase B